MEKIIKIIELEKKNLINIPISKKYISICVICGKEFEFEAIPKDRWDIPKQYFCSDECKVIYKDKLYRERLSIIPLKFRNIECDKKELVKQGIEESMFITGASGVGKTVLMAGIIKEILRDKDKKVKWISYPGFIMELQSMFRKENDGATPFNIAEEIATFPGTLAIDDIGAEKITAFVQQITYYIINYREQEMLHTIITSNFSLNQIDEQIDTRISSRIGGMCKVIKIQGHDRRLQK